MSELLNDYNELINIYNEKISEADQILYRIAEKSLEIKLANIEQIDNAQWN